METPSNIKFSQEEFKKGFSIGDIVEITEIPILRAISPAEASGLFVTKDKHINGTYTKIRYPLNSELFNFAPIPFEWIIPNREELVSRYKILNDPFYTTWYPQKNHAQYREGLGYIVEKPVIKTKDVEDITTNFKVIKTFALKKYYAPIMDIPDNINVTIEHFRGTIISFLLPYGGIGISSLRHYKSTDELLVYLTDMFKISYGRDENKKLEQESNYIETLSSVIVKIVNKFGIYLEIPLKLIKHA